MAQDNAAQSIKDLEKDIENLNKKIIESIKILEGFDVDVADLFAKARESGIANTDKLVDYLAKRLSNLQLKKFSSPFLAAFDEKEIDRAAKKYADLLEKQDVVEKARSIAVGGRKFGELQKEDLKSWREFSALLTTIDEQKKQIEQATPGSAEAGRKLYNEQLAFQKAQEMQSQERKRIAQEEAEVKRKAAEDEKQLVQEIKEEERKAKEEALQRYKEEKAYADDVEKRKHKTKERELNEAFGQQSKQRLEAEKRMNQAVQQQMQYYRQLHTLYKGYKDLQEKPNKTKEDIAILEQTKQKILEILRLSKQLELENKGSRQAGINATNFQRLADNLINASKETKTLKANLNNLLPTLQRLASAFGVAFSVRGLAQFGKKLIETRGEFEMQFVAMKQIIGDVDAATKIWNQTMQQALQSPFKAMELVKYTKQLAAYRIETDKLFDTTKRLADVSAGLGVDMQRLILAYGQVKAANYLRASEIRQFTEAGVNVLGELAQYFTEIRGTAYSTAQVMEMVTKRMVRFEDVEAIFKRMTDAGGTFFNMQEVQANTVKGQINKLHDAYDQMLNTIGQANQGVIRNFISLLIDMVKNWQKVANTMKWVGGILGSVIIATRAMRIEMEATAFAEAGTAISLRGLSGAMARYIAAAKGAETATRGFSLALKSVPVWGWILAGVSALIGVGSAIASKQRQIREETEAFNESTKELRKDIAYVDSYTNAIVKLSTEIKALNEIENKTEEQEKRLVEAQEERERLIKELAETNPQYANTIKALKDDVDALLASEKEELETLKATLAIRQALKDEGVKGKVEEYESATAAENKAVSDIENNKIAIIDYIGTLNEAGEVESKLLDNLRKQSGTMSAIGKEGMSELESEVESFARAVKEDILNFDEAYGKFVDLYTKLSAGISKSAGQGAYYSNFIQVFKDAAQYGKALSDAQWDTYSAEIAIKGVLDEVFSKYKYYEQYISLSRSFEKATTDEEKQKVRTQILKFWSDVFEQEGFVGASRKLAENYFIDMIGSSFGIKSFSQANNETKKGFTDWQKRVNEAIDKAATDFQKKRDELSEEAKKYLPEIQLYKISDPFQSLEDAQEAILKKLKDIRAKIASYEVKGQVAIDNEEYKALKLEEQEAEKVRIILGAIAKAVGGGGRQENASKLISLIKEMRSEYDKLSKSAYGYAKSEEKVRDAYKDSVKEILGKAGITDYDFTTNEGMIQALEKVKTYATRLGKDAAAEVQKYIDQLETEIEINAQVKIREDFVKNIEKAFNDYELTLELDKLNISPEAAKDLFPEFDSKTLGELQDAMQAFYEKQGASFDEEDLKAYKQWSDKIDSEILKSRKEKAKKYSKYLEKEYSERAKVEMQYAKDVAFVTANFNGEQQKNILKGIEDKYQKDINELTWKSFKESSFYVEMMDDLSSVPADYMKIMLDKIEELLAHPETLSPRALKEAINARQKILEAQMDINSISVMRESLKEMRDAATDVGGKTWSQTKKRLDEEQTAQAEKLKGLEEEIRCYEELQGQLKGLEQHDEAVVSANRALPEDVASMLENTDIDTLIGQYSDELDSLSVSEDAATSAEKDANAEIQARIEYLQRIIPLLVDYRTALNERAAYQATDAGENALFARNGGETSSSVGDTINEYKKEADEVSNRLSSLKKWQKAFKNFSDGMSKWNAAVADAITKVGAMGDAFYDTFDALGGETNVLTEGWKEFGDTMVQTITQALTLIPQLVAGFIAAGTSINAAMGLIGLIAEAVQLVFVAIGAFAKLHDARYEREIEIQQKKIDDLQRAYDRLEKSIEKTFDTVSYIREYNQEVQNLNEQYEALANQIDAEKAKKNVDEDKLQDYADKQQEIIDNLEEIKQQQIEVFGGIGEEGYRDAAQGFVDAWKSAFLETGDGLQGLQDHFDEFLNDWFVKQATMRIAANNLAPLFQKIDQAVGQYGDGGANVTWRELQEINDLKDLLLEQTNEQLKELAGVFGLGGEGSLSGLDAGIQGMTEEQANILEAYWNSVRGYTASIDANVATIVGLLSNGAGKGDISGGVNYNPMLQQITLVEQNTKSINALLQSVTRSGHPMGQSGIKVFVN